MFATRILDNRHTWTLRIALVLAGSLLMALGARVSVEIGVIPITFQPLALSLVAALLGSRLGVLAMIAYLIEGASGLPVFAGGAAGAHFLLGPSAGYLWAYPVATFAIARLYEAGLRRNYALRWCALVAGLAIIYAGGASVLSLFVGVRVAFAVGVAPFVLLDLAKLALAAFVPGTRLRGAL